MGISFIIYPQKNFKKQKKKKNRLSISFTFNEDYVITSEEGSSSGMIWNVKTGELSQRLTGHTNIIKSVACSPIEPALMTCRFDKINSFQFLFSLIYIFFLKKFIKVMTIVLDSGYFKMKSKSK